MIRLESGHYLSPVGAFRDTAAARFIETRYWAGMTLPRHGHDFAYLVLMVDGALRERTRGTTHDLSAGWLCYNDAGESHENQVLSGRARCLNVELSGGLMSRLREEGVRPRESVLYTHAGLAVGAIARLYAAVLDPGPEIETEEALVNLLASLWRAPARVRANPSWMRRAIDILHSQFRDPPALTDLAAEVGVNHVHLCRAFRSTMGCTIGAYLRALKAQSALASVTSGNTTTASLAAIAVREGFADQSHMTRAFAHAFGRSPKRLRQASEQRIFRSRLREPDGLS